MHEVIVQKCNYTGKGQRLWKDRSRIRNPTKIGIHGK
jgi:hypothetical protein